MLLARDFGLILWSCCCCLYHRLEIPLKNLNHLTCRNAGLDHGTCDVKDQTMSRGRILRHDSSVDTINVPRNENPTKSMGI